MATKIRLKRIGRRNRPFYRAVVMDSRKRRDGAAIEELGWYNPISTESQNYSLNEDRILYWLGEGAQVSDTVHYLMKRSGLAMRWHLIRKGLDEKAIEKEMQKWALQKEEAKKRKGAKKENKMEAAPEVVEQPVEEKAEAAEIAPKSEETESEAAEPAHETAVEDESKDSEPAETADEEKSTGGYDTPSVQEETNNEATEEAPEDKAKEESLKDEEKEEK